MALTADTTKQSAGKQLIAPQIADAIRIFAGSYSQIGSRDHGTAAKVGAAAPFASEAGAIATGFNSKGNTLGSVATSPVPEAELDVGGQIVKDLTCAGLAGTKADVMRLVYATDDATFTLVRPATLAQVVGVVTRFVSGTVCDVLFLGIEALVALGLAGGGAETKLLAVISGASGGGGTFATGIEMQGHGRITGVYGTVVEPLVGGGASLSVNLEIRGTNVTGGVIPWVLAAAAGSKKAGTAVTAANVFSNGSLIDVEIAESTVSTAGIMAVYANILREPGL